MKRILVVLMLVSSIALTNLVDLRDVRMIERRSGLRFRDETAHAVLVCGNVGRQDQRILVLTSLQNGMDNGPNIRCVFGSSTILVCIY